jgi:SAM-dependent methyltransferase
MLHIPAKAQTRTRPDTSGRTESGVLARGSRARVPSLSTGIRRALALPRRSTLLTVGWFLAQNFIARHSSITVGGTQSKGQDPREAAGYAAGAFHAILTHAGLAPSDLRCQRVLELGPGDNLGLSLRFLAAGASEAVCLDRFEITRDRSRERRIYEWLLQDLSPTERERLEPVIQLDPDLRFDPRRLTILTGLGIEEAAGVLQPGSFDLIVSVAVLEHVQDLDEAFSAMDQLLTPGGLMLHQIDFRDHGMFTSAGKHPLTFLTLSPRLWGAMTRDFGGPNRRLLDFYRKKVLELGYESRLIVTDVIDEPTSLREPYDLLAQEVEISERAHTLIAQIRPRLAYSYRHLPDEDLAVSGVFLVARKPA